MMATLARLGALKSLGRALGYSAAILAVLALLWLVRGCIEDTGAVKQRNADMERTIENADKANKAAERVARDPASARDECLRHARNPADC